MLFFIILSSSTICKNISKDNSHKKESPEKIVNLFYKAIEKGDLDTLCKLIPGEELKKITDFWNDPDRDLNVSDNLSPLGNAFNNTLQVKSGIMTIKFISPRIKIESLADKTAQVNITYQVEIKSQSQISSTTGDDTLTLVKSGDKWIIKDIKDNFNATFSGMGRVAPKFTLHDMRGKTVDVRHFKGKKAVLLVFWTGWIPECTHEVPELNEIYNLYKNKGLEILAINMAEEKKEVLRAIEENNIIYRVLLDIDGVAASSYEVFKFIPTHVLVDINGNVIYYEYRTLPSKELIEKNLPGL